MPHRGDYLSKEVSAKETYEGGARGGVLVRALREAVSQEKAAESAYITCAEELKETY